VPAECPRVVVAGVAALAAAVLAAGCGFVADTPPAKPAAPAPPAALHGEAARAAGAVDRLERSLLGGEVERLCRPGAVFTSAVIAQMSRPAGSCEASVELSEALVHPPALKVTKLTQTGALATARVRVGDGSTIPLDIVRSGRRWLVSFSDGVNPIGVLDQAIG
jgi:hypothetical protein